MGNFLIKAISCCCLLLVGTMLRADNDFINLTTEICYNGIDDNGDGMIDGEDPLCKTISVTTSADVLDGDISSVANLRNTPGTDGAISLREAIAATQSSISRSTFHIIDFNLPSYDFNHFYYKEDGIANQVTQTNKARTVTLDDSSIEDKDADYPRSWFQLTVNSTLPELGDNVMIDGYGLRQTQMNQNEFGGAINTIIRIEILTAGNFPIFTIKEAQSYDSQVVIRGICLNAPEEIIKITSGTKGGVWLYGNYFGMNPTALSQKIVQKNLIDIQGATRRIFIGSNRDNNNDNGEINLLAGTISGQSAINLNNTEFTTISHNYFGVGLKSNNGLNGNEGIAIKTEDCSNNKFSNNIISFYETAFNLFLSEDDTIQHNLIGVHSVDNTNLVIDDFGGITKRCKSLFIDNNTIAHSQTGWRFLETRNSQFTHNQVFGNLGVGLSIVDETMDGAIINEENFIYQNTFHDNFIGILIGQDAAKNALIQNSIYANGSLGIDLSTAGINADGISQNDLNDTDNGPNQLLNFPSLEVTNYTVIAAMIKVSLDIDDSYSSQEGYRIEFFANSSSTDRGGEIYLGYVDVEGDVTELETTVALPATVASDFYISATTSIMKVAAFANVAPHFAFEITSEFSESVPMPTAEICDNNIDDDGDDLIDCADPDCANYADGGTILGTEKACQSFDPQIIENETTPFIDARETVFYQWQKSSNNGGVWTDISGATSETYDPPNITQTTLYRRLLKKHLCNDWLFSNEIEKKIISVAIPELNSLPAGNDLCANIAYEFAAKDAGEGSNYSWDFGEFATPRLVTGLGSHTIKFDKLETDTTNEIAILLEIEREGCIKSTSTLYNLHPILEINNVSATQPTSCGGADGSISVMASGEPNACIALSIDGGNTYLPDNQLTANDLSAGAYDLFIRYCEDACPINAGIVSLSDPAAIRTNDDYVSGYCPGILFQGNVATNDTLGDNPVFSLAADANYGRINLEDDGKFTYTPIANTCGLDQFSYKVCNGNSGCCATAIVHITFGDDAAPTFVDLPVNITIGLDDEIPMPAEVQTMDNCPSTKLDFEEESTKTNSACEAYNYTITRTWTATDQCGNSASHVQTISVVDETAPDIFRIHTLPNGTKMVAGVMEFTSQHWKTIYLPYNFSDNPIIFTQLTTNNEATAATVRLRNISQNQFEIKLQEAETDDSIHTKESVAWMAMEVGTQTQDFQFQADTIGVTHGWTTVPFFQSFANIPLFFANMQTIKDKDAATVRNNGVNWNNGKIRIQEENSAAENLAHTSETVGYLVMDDEGDLHSKTGSLIGENGRKKVTHEWTTIDLKNTYNNPVVIANSLSIDDFDAAMVRVRNVTTNSFEVKVEEWAYLDGVHSEETIGYLVIEGSLPLEEPAYFCENNGLQIDISNELIALDNTGQILSIDYEERLGFSGREQLTHRDWTATDGCGNIGAATQTVACPGIALKAKTVLQGALVGSDDPLLMRDDLRRKNLIPTLEPYTELAGFEHVGASGGEVLKGDLLDIEGEDAIVDWVFLELRSRLNKNHIVATAVGLVQRDGDIMSNKGDSLIVFPSAYQSKYYVAVRHRNHICMVINETQEFSTDNLPILDFTDVQTTNNLAGTSMETMNTMWSGDLNQDNKVIYQGPDNDIFYILLDVLFDPENTKRITNFVSNTYAIGDFNLDGKVVFQGPDNDRSALLFNTILIHPDNEGFFSNFILSVGGKDGN